MINSTVDPRLTASLKAIGTLMSTAQEPWWIIASAAVALHSADPGHVGDVDVLLGIADAIRILPSIGIEPRPGSEHADFQSSIFGTWNGTSLPVEFMAGFRHRREGTWRPVLPATRHAIEVGGTTVFVPDRVELRYLLSTFGRPKDIERSRRLAVATVAPSKAH